VRILAKIIALLVLVGAGAWFYRSEPEPQGLTLYGNIDQRQLELAFTDSERVAEILVQEGDEVNPGQVLARLETRRLEDRIAVAEAQAAAAEAALTKLKNGTRPEEIGQAKAAVATAKAEAALAEAQYERFNALWNASKEKAVSRQDVDEKRRQRDVARAKLNFEQASLLLAEKGPRSEDVAEAEALLLAQRRGLDQLRNQLGDAELRSPIRAVVNNRLMEPGEMASPQRAVFSLAVSSPKWVRAYVSEHDLGRVRHGMNAVVRTDSHPSEGIAGTLGFISSVAEFTPKTVETPELRTSLVYEVRIYV
jgi:HlyD family secretion protein